MRLIRVLSVLVCVACFDRGERHERADKPAQSDAQLYSSAGEVRLTDGGSLQFTITSEKYKQWYAAQQGFDKRIKSRFGALLQPASPSERTIARAVEYLQGEPRARDAIQRAGMSVRDFVVTTVALEQEMRVASESRAPAVDSMPLPYPYPYPLDTAHAAPPYPPTTVYPPATQYPPAYQPYPAPYPTTTPYPTPTPTPYPTTPSMILPERRVDTTRRVDTVFVPTPVAPTPTPVVRDTSVTRRDPVLPPRDSLTPRRDTLPTRRDSVVPVVPRRDTLPAPRPPRDTLRRDTIPPDTIPQR
jgi:hypothetical protein